MSKDVEKIKIFYLTKNLNHYSKEYYQNHNSLVSDSEFDEMMRELERLESLHPEWKLPDSPTSRVGSDSVKGFRKAAHAYPMLSLQDIYTPEELGKFVSSSRCKEFSVECKLDGLSLSLIYEKGKLVRAVTRGNGSEGDDVTRQALEIESIPKELWLGNGKFSADIEVRGEVVMPFAAFERWNSEHPDEKFANPRNAASGTLKSYEAEKCRERGLFFVAYYLFYRKFNAVQNAANGEGGSLGTLSDIGFRTPADWKAALVSTPSCIMENIRKIKSLEFPFPIDGVVVKANSQFDWERLGYTDKFYKWGVAFKFKAADIKSRLKRIVWQLAPSGRVTPVAEYEPVEMFGTVCRRATLNNPDWMEKNLKGISIGDYLLLTKGGEIIPKVTGYEVNPEKGLHFTHFVDDAVDTTVIYQVNGPVMVPSVIGGRQTYREGAYLMAELKATDAAPKVAEKREVRVSSDALKGKTFLVSGNFGSPKARRDIEDAVKANGGKLAGGVTLSVDYYVLPDDLEEWKKKAASKWEKIQSYMHQDRVITKDEFYKML